MLNLITMFLPLVDKLVARIPDPAMRERAALDMQAELLKAAVSESQGQSEINKIEAAHSSIFVSGWRPAIGWVGAIGLGYNFLLYPFLDWFLTLVGVTTALPKPDNETLMALVYAMLGIGAMRSFDKWKGTSR